MRLPAGAISQRFNGLASDLNRAAKRLILLGFDLCAVGASLMLALRSARVAVGDEGRLLLLVGAPAVALVLFWVFGLYRSVVRSMGSHGPFAIGTVAIISAALLAVTNRLLPDAYVSADVIYRYCFFLLVIVGGGRLLARDLLRGSSPSTHRIIIYGAGEAGRRLAEVMASGPWRAVAFVDDDAQLSRAIIRGLRVYPPRMLSTLIPKLRVRQVLLAMPSLSRRRRNEIIDGLLHLGVAVRTIPDLTDIVTGVAQVDDVKDVSAADVLGRDPAPAVNHLVDACVRDQSVLITGAGGSIGSELSRQIIRLGPRRLVLHELSEHALYQIERELHAISTSEGLKVEIVALLGSAQHKRRIRQILRTYGINTIYHAAAYKHVPIVEGNIVEGVQNNVINTWHTAEAAMATGVSTFVLVSTDKAVNPTNVMGATKRMAEIVLQGLHQQNTSTRFCMVRFGNVLDSSGSVVPLFREQIRGGGPVTVTHPEVTRYFMTIPEAVNLVLHAGAIGKGGDVFVLEMGNPVRIVDLARRMIELSGLSVRDAENPEGDIEIQFTGLRPAEKLCEELVIGNSLAKTEHPRILRAVEHALPCHEVEALIAELELAVERFDCALVLDILKRAVGEYRPAETTFDLVDRAHQNIPRRERLSEASVSQVFLDRAS
jgi:FlaA1/EpsC-like NDP-sugar epimerase